MKKKTGDEWRGEPIFQTWKNGASLKEIERAVGVQFDEIDKRLGPGPGFGTMRFDDGQVVHFDDRPDEGAASKPTVGTTVRIPRLQ